MEFDLTDEQIENVKRLEKRGIGVGEAIDLLFEIKDEAMQQMDKVDENIGIISDYVSSRDSDEKAESLEKNFGDSDETYEMKIQEAKHKVSWGRDFFKF